MIVQTAPDGAPRFVILMSEHTALAGEFARHFGNDRFEPVAHPEEALYIIGNHDAGWAGLDAEFRIDPATGFPYNLVETPFELVMGTSRGSPDFNEQRHPFCGLLSSMHSWGLYNGRYGLSDMVLLDGLKQGNRAMAEEMLDGELARQERLKETLASDADTADWIDDAALMQSYKQLQFFDTLALYFNRTHEGARGKETFPHVPLSATQDADVTVTPAGKATYRVSPWPFDESPLEISFAGRYMEKMPADTGTAAQTAKALPSARQTVTLLPA